MEVSGFANELAGYGRELGSHIDILQQSLNDLDRGAAYTRVEAALNAILDELVDLGQSTRSAEGVLPRGALGKATRALRDMCQPVGALCRDLLRATQHFREVDERRRRRSKIQTNEEMTEERRITREIELGLLPELLRLYDQIGLVADLIGRTSSSADVSRPKGIRVHIDNATRREDSA